MLKRVVNVVLSMAALFASAAAQQPGQPVEGHERHPHETLTSSSPFKCIESYAAADKTHDGTDYGAMITAAVQASPLTSVTQIKACVAGDHAVFSTATLDRPISLWLDGARLVPQASMSSMPVTTSASVKANSRMVTVASATGVAVGDAVGGVGIPPGSYVQAVSGNSITLSTLPQLQFYGVATEGSDVIQGVNSLAGLVIGQTLSGHGSWPFVSGSTSIRSIDYVTNSVTVSVRASAGSPIPNTYIVGGSWTSDLTLVHTTPVVNWIYNAAALHNQYQQMIGASQHGVWIVDTGVRSLPGVQGVQVSGYDGFNSYDLRVDDLDGSAEILGGYTGAALNGNRYSPVRESSFVNDQIRNSGDAHTGQPALAIFTPNEGNLADADEINQIDFIGGHYVCSNGVAVGIGSYNSAHTDANAVNGPRLIWFNDNYQVEGCSVTFDTAAQSDTIYVQNAGDLHFGSGEIAGAGQGKAVFRLDNLHSLTAVNSTIIATSIPVTYTVNLVHGSKTAAYGSGGGTTHRFNATQTWDGTGVMMNGTVAHLAPSSPVASNGLTATLASAWTGQSGSFPMTVGYAGAFIEASGALAKTTLKPDVFSGIDPPSLAFLDVKSSDSLFELGAAYLPGNAAAQAYDDHDGENFVDGSIQYHTGFAVPTVRAGVSTSWNMLRRGEADTVDVHASLPGGWCWFSSVLNGTPAARNCFTGTGGLGLTDALEQQMSLDNYGIRLTPFVDSSVYPSIYGTNTARTIVQWSILHGNASFTSLDLAPAPTTPPAAGAPPAFVPGDGHIGAAKYLVNGIPGYTGTKTAGSCVFTITSGIITNVTGC